MRTSTELSRRTSERWIERPNPPSNFLFRSFLLAKYFCASRHRTADCSFAYNSRRIPSPTWWPRTSLAKILSLCVNHHKTVGVCFDRTHTKNSSSPRPGLPSSVISAQFWLRSFSSNTFCLVHHLDQALISITAKFRSVR